jgi:hypothetical protein
VYLLECNVHLVQEMVQWWILSGSMKAGEFFDQLRDYQLLKNDSAAWSLSVS